MLKLEMTNSLKVSVIHKLTINFEFLSYLINRISKVFKLKKTNQFEINSKSISKILEIAGYNRITIQIIIKLNEFKIMRIFQS